MNDKAVLFSALTLYPGSGSDVFFSSIYPPDMTGILKFGSDFGSESEFISDIDSDSNPESHTDFSH